MSFYFINLNFQLKNKLENEKSDQEEKTNEYTKEDIKELENLGVINKDIGLDFDPELNLETTKEQINEEKQEESEVCNEEKNCLNNYIYSNQDKGYSR